MGITLLALAWRNVSLVTCAPEKKKVDFLSATG